MDDDGDDGDVGRQTVPDTENARSPTLDSHQQCRAVDTIIGTSDDARTSFLHIILCINSTRFNFQLLMQDI